MAQNCAHPGTRLARLIMCRLMPKTGKITICNSAEELRQIRPVWDAITSARQYTVFQNFELNLLAAQMFAEREQPQIICAEMSNGLAIVPAVQRHADQTVRLLGEELFDYRCFLHCGDKEALRLAMGHLAGMGRSLEIVAVRETDRHTSIDLPMTPFTMAPGVCCGPAAAEAFAAEHLRLARNLRRLSRLGFKLHRYDGTASPLLRLIYERKAAQNPSSLFHDAMRIEFIVQAAALLPRIFEVYTLEDDFNLAAAVVTLRDGKFRRFYTGWFAPELARHSPALALIYEVTRD